MPADTPLDEVTAGIERVAGKAKEWAELSAAKKRALFEECLELAKGEVDNLVAAACASRGYDMDNAAHGHLVGDAALCGLSSVGGWINGAIDFFNDLDRTGKPPQGSIVAPRPDGTHRVQMFPRNFKEGLLGDGAAHSVVVRGAVQQFDPLKKPPCVLGVLGAGNTDIPNDIIDPMCKENAVVVYKSNPVMARGAEVKKRIFKPLIDKGYLAMFHGGIETGKVIVESPKTDKLGCTGSVRTHDAIVWGGQDKTDPKAEPVMTKPLLSELGSVNPYIVVPGAWSASDIEHQARALISYKMMNNAHVCASPQVILTCKQWPQREAFIEAVRKQVKECPTFRCFYPGVRKGAYEEHKKSLGEGSDVTVQQTDLGFGEADAPLLFKAGVLPESDALQFRNEAFCPILIEVPLDTESSFHTFLTAAVDFAHNRCWGSLTCNIIVDDDTKSKNEEALDCIIDDMRFGAVGVNCPAVGANSFAVLSWGGFPGHTARDVQSGIGHMGNFGCYENLEKTVMKGRFQNQLQFKNSGGPQYLMRKYVAVSKVFLYMTYGSIVRFVCADACGC